MGKYNKRPKLRSVTRTRSKKRSGNRRPVPVNNQFSNGGGYSPAPAVKPEEPKKGNIIFLIAAIIALIAIILALAVTCWSGSDEEAAEEVDTALISAETESEAEAPDTAIAEEEPAPVTAAVVE